MKQVEEELEELINDNLKDQIPEKK